MEDARFEDGGDQPLRLKAQDADDLQVISALVQDAICSGNEMTWRKDELCFALLLNRFRWEDLDAAKARGRPLERVQSVLLIENAKRVRTQGLEFIKDKDAVYNVLSVSFDQGADEGGLVSLVVSGGGLVAVDVELLEVILKDVTRPYIAPSRKMPAHDE